MLRRNRILVMDEATANVDLKTDDLIQATIRREMGGCTVITVAHRLNTIMDYDRVLVLSEGQLVEYAEPFVLLQDPNSAFYKLVEETGRTNLDAMIEIARQHHNRRKQSASSPTASSPSPPENSTVLAEAVPALARAVNGSEPQAEPVRVQFRHLHVHSAPVRQVSEVVEVDPAVEVAKAEQMKIVMQTNESTESAESGNQAPDAAIVRTHSHSDEDHDELGTAV
eukprot:Colp12_sorted_trinity150504_noHs@10441